MIWIRPRFLLACFGPASVLVCAMLAGTLVRAEGKIVGPDTVPIYTLADTTGQVWTHTDPNWLRTWVAGRNRNLAARTVPVYFTWPITGGSCVSGNCPRR